MLSPLFLPYFSLICKKQWVSERFIASSNFQDARFHITNSLVPWLLSLGSMHSLAEFSYLLRI
jgi:hypothetical protein